MSGEKSGIDMLNEEGEVKVIELKGQKFTLGKMTFAQIFKFLKWLALVSVGFAEAFGKKDPNITDQKQDLTNVLSIVDEDTCADFFVIALSRNGNPEVNRDLIKTFTLEDMVVIVAEVLERNDWDVILKNAQRAGDIIKKLMALFNSPTPTPPQK